MTLCEKAVSKTAKAGIFALLMRNRLLLVLFVCNAGMAALAQSLPSLQHHENRIVGDSALPQPDFRHVYRLADSVLYNTYYQLFTHHASPRQSAMQSASRRTDVAAIREQLARSRTAFEEMRNRVGISQNGVPLYPCLLEITIFQIGILQKTIENLENNYCSPINIGEQ